MLAKYSRKLLRRWIKAFLKSVGVYVFRAPPRGTDLTYDFRHALPHQPFHIIFDVGANIGQSASWFLRDYAEACIWCFEPSAQLYAGLKNRYANNPRVTCEHCAIGSSGGEATLIQTANSSMFHLSGNATVLPPGVTAIGSEGVRVMTLDDYCSRCGIDHVDFLKIDTEGHDLEVLRGAIGMLASNRVACVQCECSMNPENKFHCAFEDIKDLLENFNYRLFGIYEQTQEVFESTPNLRRVDAVYISSDVILTNPISVP